MPRPRDQRKKLVCPCGRVIYSFIRFTTVRKIRDGKAHIPGIRCRTCREWLFDVVVVDDAN
jgi:hypothetical protein